MSEFPKQYDPKIWEPNAQKLWESINLGKPQWSDDASTFYIPIPPPNVTGNLHIGHALTLSLEDIMIRYHRMKWDNTLWIPGTDHAGIATQAQVEKRLEKSGTSRKEIGREAFLEECLKWIKEYGGNIQDQIKTMWASVDWERERFTFDEKSNKLVENIFVDLYNKWLIYRGEYMVNYSPVLESVISDIEVDHEEVDEKMYYINYFVSGSDKELLVATTRPETLLWDQAIAVHPKDKRYKKLIGRSVILPIVNREIPIIGDTMVDMEFGTGVVKVTPAHDPSDFEMAKRHNLRTDYRVIEKTGYMSQEAWIFAWLKATEDARENIVELLKSKWNLVKIEPYKHTVWFCSRGRCRVESIVSTQWFVRASVMAEKVIAWYKKKDFQILPERFNKTFEDWIYNLHDWCISRQLWWGHQVPAYFHRETGELLGVTTNPADLYTMYWEANVRRDDDVLDTWFSSALWPFSILDWNFETPSEFFKKYYPANVLETGYDILFFWVIRMLLMGYEYTWETPFKTVYLHGLILDETGKKMSKSFGNVIDPLIIIKEYSVDALRLSTILGNTPGNNLNFSLKTVQEYSLFLNKFWNITRFVWMNIGNITDSRETLLEKINNKKDDLLPYEKWILSRLSWIIQTISKWMEDYTFASSGSDLLSFIRDEFADLAIESYKIEKERSVIGKEVLSLCMLDILSLVHPYIPHISETLYSHITDGKILAISLWPTNFDLIDKDAEKKLNDIFAIARTIRNLRAETGIKPWEYRDVTILCPTIRLPNLESNSVLLKWLARIETLTFSNKIQKTGTSAYALVLDYEIYVDAEIDNEKIEEEKNRLLAQIEDKKGYLRSLDAKLSSSSFTKNAPEKIVRAEMEKKHQATDQLRKLEEKYRSFEN
jgi:valyl-tRNA synthetase